MWIARLDAEHADADRADQGDGGRHDRAQVRPHRQHHIQRGQGADRRFSACPTARAPASPASSPGIARKTVAHNVTINNLLPGMFDTDRLKSSSVARGEDAEQTGEKCTPRA